MIRLLGKAIALSALVNVLPPAGATVPSPLRMGLAPTLMLVGSTISAGERPTAEWSSRRRTNVRNGGLAPVLDDQIIPDRAVQNCPQIEAISRPQITSS